MDIYDTKDVEYIRLVCAHVIGRKIGALLKDSPDVYARVSGILGGRPTTIWSAMLNGLQESALL